MSDDHWKYAPSTKKTFPEPKKNWEQYEQPIGPQRPSRVERVSSNPYVKKVAGGARKVVTVAKPVVFGAMARVKNNMENNPYINTPPADLVGYPNSPPTARRKRKKKSRKQSAKRSSQYDDDYGSGWQDMMKVPPAVRRWMF